MNGPLAGKQALVIGAGAGAGLNIARLLGCTGASIHVAGRNPALETVASDISADYAVPAQAHVTDLSQDINIEALVLEISPIDIFIGAMGSLPEGPFSEVAGDMARAAWTMALDTPISIAREILEDAEPTQHLIFLIDAPNFTTPQDAWGSALRGTYKALIASMAAEPGSPRINGILTNRDATPEQAAQAVLNLALDPGLAISGHVVDITALQPENHEIEP